MKTKLLTALALLVTATAPVTSVATAGQTKVGVCHDGDHGFELITIAEPAYDKHIEHGDAAPGLGVPGQPDQIFDENCVPTDSPTVDVCPNLDGVQETVPAGYELDDLRRCITLAVTWSAVVSDCTFNDSSMTSGTADITLEIDVTGDEWATWQMFFVPLTPDPRFPPAFNLPSPGTVGTNLDPSGAPFQAIITDFEWNSSEGAPFVAYGDLSLYLGNGTQNDLAPGYPFRVAVPQVCDPPIINPR